MPLEALPENNKRSEIPVTSLSNTTRTPEEKWADIGELRVRYLDWKGDGPPIVALHGLASSAHWYERVAGCLSDRYRIIAPDQRGHGKTTQASSGYDWQTLASDVAGLMDHLNMDRAAVMGHSWGGHVASNIAARFPQRVTRLVMIDGGFQNGHLLPNASWEVFRARFAPRDVSGTRQEFLERLRSQLEECWGPDLERTVLSMVYEDDQGQVRDILQPVNHAQVLRAMWDEPPSVILSRVRCPTLLVPAGPRADRANTEFSRMRERMVEAAAQITRSCHVQWIPDTIHDIGYHKPQELAQAIREFLEAK
jgi:pimeloyl-ACP methyl ester carboxylesterase